MLREFTMKVESKASGYAYQSSHKYHTAEEAVISAFIHALRKGLMMFNIIIQNGNKQEKINLTVSRAS